MRIDYFTCHVHTPVSCRQEYEKELFEIKIFTNVASARASFGLCIFNASILIFYILNMYTCPYFSYYI